MLAPGNRKAQELNAHRSCRALKTLQRHFGTSIKNAYYMYSLFDNSLRSLRKFGPCHRPPYLNIPSNIHMGILTDLFHLDLGHSFRHPRVEYLGKPT